jgi:cell division protein FtsB
LQDSCDAAWLNSFLIRAMQTRYTQAMRALSNFIWNILPILIVVATAIYLPLKLTDEKGYTRVREIKRDLQSLKMENRQIRRENEALRDQIRAIHADPDFIENIARNEMGMIAPDEVVYQF